MSKRPRTWMPLTPAERQKLYRQRLKEKDPEKFLEQKKRNAERTKRNRKRIADFDSFEQRIIRKQWREKKRNKDKNASIPQEDISSPQPDHNLAETQKVQLQKSYRKLINLKKENVKLKQEQSKMNTTLKNMQKRIKRCMQKNNKMMKLLEEKNETITKLQQKLNKIENGYNSNWSPQTKTDDYIERNLPNISREEKETVKKKILQHEVLLDTLKESYQNSKNTVVKRTLKNVLQGEKVKKYKFKMKMASFLGLKGNIRHSNKKKRNGILVNHLREFFEKDDVSRMTSGKKEVKAKKREKIQKRYLLGTLKKLYLKYRREGGKLALSTFKKYRPFHVIPPTVRNRDTCVCKKHDNLEMKAKALKLEGIIATQDLDELLAMVMCDIKRKECAYGECGLCKDKTIDYGLDGKNLDGNISWYEWILQSYEYKDKNDKDETKITKKMVKQKRTDTLKSFLMLFNEELQIMKMHSFNIAHQYKEYRRCIENLDDRSVLVHVDFSENYVCKLSKEVQSMHFGASKQQITLHTGILYTANSKIPFASISPNNDHGPDAIWAHLLPVLQWIKEKFPSTDGIHFYSDGPTVQYRQKKNFYYFSQVTKNLGFPYSTWNFFEASHGKGAADGVGGALKRNLDSLVAYGYDISDAKTAFDLLLNQTETTVKVFYIPHDAIQKNTLELIPVPNTMRLHQIMNTETANTIMYRSLSCFCPGDRPGFCKCLDVKQSSLIKQTELIIDKEKETDLMTRKLERTGVKILSDIKNTAENQKYFNLRNFDPLNLKKIDKDFDISQQENAGPSTSTRTTSINVGKRKASLKKKVKKYRVQCHSSTDDEEYSLRDSDDDIDVFDEDNSSDLYDDSKFVEAPSNSCSVREKEETKMNVKKLKIIEEFNNNCTDKEETIQEKLENVSEVRKNDAVLIRYFQRGGWKYFVGFVEDIVEKEEEMHYTIDYLKKGMHPKLKFVRTKKKDWDIVTANSIVKKIELKRDIQQPLQFYLKNSFDEVYFN